MNSELLPHYVRAFSTLHRNQNPQWGGAPHKPILLLAILDLVERNGVRENWIRLTPELVAAFHALWRVVVPAETWSERIVYAFRYLIRDRFWMLYKNGAIVDVGDLGHPTSISQLNVVADAGRFSNDLWSLIQDRSARDVLRQTLLTVYFGQQKMADQIVQVAQTDPLEAEARRLVEEAKKQRFRRQPWPIKFRESDVGYIRHNLFPQVVRRLYDHQCAVCQLQVRDSSGRTLIDAAHIMPFATYGNDDPRNGLALCPNHHRGFDAGWFSVSNAFQIIASSHISGKIDLYISNGTRLVLPTQAEYAPAIDALTWHRENVFQQ